MEIVAKGSNNPFFLCKGVPVFFACDSDFFSSKVLSVLPFCLFLLPFRNPSYFWQVFCVSLRETVNIGEQSLFRFRFQ